MKHLLLSPISPSRSARTPGGFERLPTASAHPQKPVELLPPCSSSSNLPSGAALTFADRRIAVLKDVLIGLSFLNRAATLKTAPVKTENAKPTHRIDWPA